MFNFLTKKNISIFIFYGSQTGYAESVAKHLHKEIGEKIKPIKNEIDVLNNFLSHKIHKDDFVIILLSTTGDGDFPDNAEKLYKTIRRGKEPRLDHINYALLGFGDSNYRSFCASSKVLDRRFMKLGATKFMDTVFNDEAIYNSVDDWLENIVKFLREFKKSVVSWFIDSMTFQKNNK